MAAVLLMAKAHTDRIRTDFRVDCLVIVAASTAAGSADVTMAAAAAASATGSNCSIELGTSDVVVTCIDLE